MRGLLGRGGKFPNLPPGSVVAASSRHREEPAPDGLNRSALFAEQDALVVELLDDTHLRAKKAVNGNKCKEIIGAGQFLHQQREDLCAEGHELQVLDTIGPRGRSRADRNEGMAPG